MTTASSGPAASSSPSPAAAAGHSLVLSRLLRASPAQVWQAWTDPKELAKWWGVNDSCTSTASVDLRVGGGYRVAMNDAASGKAHVTIGTFLEVQAPSRLVYTWEWLDAPEPAPTTRVTVEFREHAQGCELVLTHDQFTTALMRERHQQGWSAAAGRLGQLLASSGSSPQARNMVVWFELPTLDLDRAIRFYAAVLEVAITRASFPGGALGVLPHSDGTVGGCLVAGQGRPGDQGGPLIYLGCPGRLDAAIQAVAAHGGTVLEPRKAIGPHGFMAIIRDSEGNRVALHSP